MALRRADTLPRPVSDDRDWTYERYCAMPDDGKRYEVIRGELYLTPTPFRQHQRTLLCFAGVLDGFVAASGYGEVVIAPFDVLLSKGNVVQPDILFVSTARMAVLTHRNAAGSPDLAVEVLSPSSRGMDRRLKLAVYAEHGVAHYWLIDPLARTLEAYELREGGYVLTDRRSGSEDFLPTLFPGLTIPLATLWR